LFIDKLKGKMMHQFVYKVWHPDTAPATSDPMLTLHDKKAVRFFVEAVLAGNSLFSGNPFAICAYLPDCAYLSEHQVAEGVYCLHVKEGHPRIATLYESGMLDSNCVVTCAALIDAIAEITKEQLR
jgi:hypothetical protein